MIFIIGGTLALFFELLLLSKKNKCLCDKILAFWMFIMGVHLFLYYFYTRELYYAYPYLMGSATALPLFHGPLLFLYTGSVTRYFIKWKPIYLLHFLPVVVFMAIFFDFYISSGDGEIKFIKNIFKNPYDLYRFNLPSILISGFSYIFLTALLFRRHKHNILNNLSNSNENNNLLWLRNLLSGMLLIWLIVLLSQFVLNSSIQDDLIYITVSLFVVFIGFFGLRQGNIFVNLPDNCLIEGLIEENQPRYSRSGLKEEQAAEIEHKLAELMEHRKLFIDENISLPSLAGLMNVHPNYLSQVINERFKKNFYEFINSYRVEEFKSKVSVEKNRNKTFFALALDCGFNSKASFNSSFKKITGITPSQFVKSL